MRNKPKDDYGVQVIRRGLKVLEKLAEAEGGIGVIELAGALNLSPGTTHRILQTFLDNGYVKQNESKKYEPGTKILKLAGDFLNGLDIKKQAEPYLKELRDKTGETAHLVIKYEDEVICLANAESPRAMRVTLPVGGHNPLYCTAVGKVFLAESSVQELSTCLKGERVKKYTPNTIISLTRLKREIEKIKNAGYALDDVEYEPGVRCIASVVKNFSGSAVAAIGISGPASRITKQGIKKFVDCVISAARRLSAAMGG